MKWFSLLARLFIVPVALAPFASQGFGSGTEEALAADDPVDMVVEQLDGSQFIYVVFHALDRDGFCSPPDGAVSLHPVLNIPVDFVIEAGDGVIIETSSGSGAPGRSADDVLTYSKKLNAASASPIRTFPSLIDGVPDECQAWIKVSQSIPGPLRVLVTVAGDDGKPIGFIADLERETANDVPLAFRWSLVTWTGDSGVTPGAALRGPAGSDISNRVTALYGWDEPTQVWKAYFPGSSNVPGANDLASLERGEAYWVAVSGPGGVIWSMPSH